ncbi:MAG: NINE protein [Actinomycetales bacterium]
MEPPIEPTRPSLPVPYVPPGPQAQVPPGYAQPGYVPSNQVPPGYVPVTPVAPVYVPLGYAPPFKDVGVTYLFALLLGGFGAHHFYLSRIGFGLTYLILWLVGWFTVWFGLGFVIFLGLFVAIIVDLFLIPSYVRDANARLAGVQRPF